jgi:hypothetical protein
VRVLFLWNTGCCTNGGAEKRRAVEGRPVSIVVQLLGACLGVGEDFKSLGTTFLLDAAVAIWTREGAPSKLCLGGVFLMPIKRPNPHPSTSSGQALTSQNTRR